MIFPLWQRVRPRRCATLTPGSVALPGEQRYDGERSSDIPSAPKEETAAGLPGEQLASAFAPTLEDLDSERQQPGAYPPGLLETTAMSRDGSRVVHEQGEIVPFSSGYLLAKRWQIIQRIGKGGFGFVYSAIDLELEVEVAVKILRPELETSEESIRRFKQEIQLARQVTHGNVCRIYDVGFYHQGALRVPFLTMELLQGVTLDQRLQANGPLPIEEVQLIAEQVGRALDAAHGVGIVHADLKPANIMLVGAPDDLRAVVTDFGLASAHASGDPETEGDFVVGTPAYMAPEQVEGKHLGPAADFYALGCTLYHLISGQLPFVADTALATARARLDSGPPNLRAAYPAAPPRWSALVGELMIRDPDRRISSGAQMRRFLLRSFRRSTMLLVVAACLLVIGSGVLFLAFRGNDAPADQQSFSLSVPSDPEAAALFEEGERLWQSSRSKAAIDQWQAAIEQGHRHPRIYEGICSATYLMHSSHGSEANTIECRRAAFESSRSLPQAEQDYYEANYRFASGDYLRAVQLLVGVLETYPGDFKLSLSLARMYRIKGDRDAALQLVRKVRVRDVREEIALSAAEVMILLAQQSYEAVLQIGEEVLPKAIANEMQWEALTLLSGLAVASKSLGKNEQSLRFGEQAYSLAKSVQSTWHEADALLVLVSLSMDAHAFGQAREYLETRIALLQELGNEQAYEESLITKAEILAATGLIKESEQLLTDVVVPRLRSPNPRVYWLAYGQLTRSAVRRTLGRIDAALEDCRAAFAIYRARGLRRMEAFSQMVCAEALLDDNQIPEAVVLLEQARLTRDDLGLDLLLLQNDLLDAEVLLAQGEAHKAYALASTVTLAYRQRDLAMDESASLELMARAALAAGERQLAESAIAKALSIGSGEHFEQDLQMQVTALRVRALAEGSSAVRRELLVLKKRAEETGYARLATMSDSTGE